MERQWAILTAMGKDRVGIVEDLTDVLERWECNIEESKMAVLGDQFAVILLLAGPPESVSALLNGKESWDSLQELHISLRPTEGGKEKKEGIPYVVETVSLDSPGIVHMVTQVLREYRINIEDLATETAFAPFTGSPMFIMKLRVTIPEGVAPATVREALHKRAFEKDLDIKFEPVAGIAAW